MSDLATIAHVDGYRAGMSGRLCTAPAYADGALREAWLRGWRIGSQRRRPDGERAFTNEAQGE